MEEQTPVLWNDRIMKISPVRTENLDSATNTVVVTGSESVELHHTKEDRCGQNPLDQSGFVVVAVFPLCSRHDHHLDQVAKKQRGGSCCPVLADLLVAFASVSYLSMVFRAELRGENIQRTQVAFLQMSAVPNEQFVLGQGWPDFQPSYQTTP